MKKRYIGFVLILIQAILDVVMGIAAIVVFATYYNREGSEPFALFYSLGCGIVFIGLGILNVVLGLYGKKSKKCSHVLLIINIWTNILSIIGIIGASLCYNSFKREEKEKLPIETPTSHPAVITDKDNNQIIDNTDLLYKHNSLLLQILRDPNHSEDIQLQGENGKRIDFHQIYVCVLERKLYCILKPIDKIQDVEENEVMVFGLEENEELGMHQLLIVLDEKLAKKVFEMYEQQFEISQKTPIGKRVGKRKLPVLDLYDVSIHEKDWRLFKKSATQEEFLVLAIGSKYRLEKGRIKSIFFALGIVLSIVIGILTIGSDVGLIILIGGYVLFSFLSTKAIRYQDTYEKCYRKLNKKNKIKIKEFISTPIILRILDWFIQLAIVYITIPYQAILLLIGMFAPNFVIAKNGVLVSIPKGYDIGALGTIGTYYESFNFLDEYMDTLEKEQLMKHPSVDVYENGYKRNLNFDGYYNNLDRYKDDTGRYWYSDDNGSTFYRE